MRGEGLGEATSHIFPAGAFRLEIIHRPLMVFHRSFLFPDRMTQIVGFCIRHGTVARI